MIGRTCAGWIALRELALQFVAALAQAGAQLAQCRALHEADALPERELARLGGGRRELHELAVQLRIELQVGALVGANLVVVGRRENRRYL